MSITTPSDLIMALMKILSDDKPSDALALFELHSSFHTPEIMEIGVRCAILTGMIVKAERIITQIRQIDPIHGNLLLAEHTLARNPQESFNLIEHYQQHELSDVQQLSYLRILGLIHFRLGDNRRAKDILRQAWLRFSTLDVRIAEIGLVLANIYLTDCDFRAAIDYSSEALKFPVMPYIRADLLLLNAHGHMFAGDLGERCLAPLQELESMLSEIPSTSAKIHYCRGMYHRLRQELDLTRNAWQKAAQASQQMNDRDYLLQVCWHLTACCVELNDFDAAMKWAGIGLGAFDNSDESPTRKARRLMLEGGIKLYVHKQPHFAIQTLQQALSLYGTNADPTDQFVCAVLNAECLMLLGQTEQADQLLTMIAQFRTRVQSPVLVGSIFNIAPTVVQYIEDLPAKHPFKGLYEDFLYSRPRIPNVVQLRTLTVAPHVLVNGQKAQIYKYSPIVFAYILSYPQSTTALIAEKLFPDLQPKQGIKKILEAKRNLETSIPGLRIEGIGRDGLRCEWVNTRFRWDEEELRNATNAPGFRWAHLICNEELLLQTDLHEEWLGTHKLALKELLAQRAIREINEINVQDVHMRLKLVKHLIRSNILEPSDTEAITILKIELAATREVYGLRAAQQQWRTRCEWFSRAVGEIPHEYNTSQPF
jgi:tetratricopeptide (TPR) repeat protein